MAYLVSDFLTLVRQYGMLPTSAANGTADADLLRVADEELRTRITPLVVASNQEWWVTTKRTALTANQRAYRIPARAVGGRVRELQLYRANGTYRNLKRYELEDSYSMAQDATGEPELFWVKGETVHVWPKPASSSGYLQFDFMARPGRLTNIGVTGFAITSITELGSNQVELATASAVVSPNAVAPVDIVRSSSGFSFVCVDVAGESQTGPKYLVYDNTQLPESYTQLLIGDYIFPADLSYVIPLPTELHGVFVNYTVASIKMQMGDLQSAAAFEQRAQKLATEALQTFEPRIDGEPRVMRNGLLWRTKNVWWQRGQ